MALHTITVYFNTGFNSTDIPATQAVIELAEKKAYTDFYYLREDIDNPQVRINDSYDNLCDVDYVKIVNNSTSRICFYFATPHSLAKQTTALSLSLDALTTLGGAANLTYISGWQARGHISKEEDTLFSNLASEDFTPIKELEVVKTKDIHGNGVGVDIKPIVTSVNLTTASEDLPDNQMDVIQGIVKGETTETVMYFPKLSFPNTIADYNCYDFNKGGYKSYSIPCSGVYESDGVTTQKGLAKLFSAGQLSLQSSYVVPGEWVGGINSVGGSTKPDGVYGHLYGVHNTVALSDFPYQFTVPNYTIKNNKVYSMFRSFAVMNIGSGDMVSKRPSELYNGGTAPSLWVWSDPCATGKPYARFSHINSTPIQYADCVQGLQWNNNQLTMEGASGSFWNNMQFAYQSQSLSRSQMAQDYALQRANVDNQSAMLKEGAKSAAIAGLAGAAAAAGAALAAPVIVPVAGATALTVSGSTAAGVAAAGTSILPTLFDVSGGNSQGLGSSLTGFGQAQNQYYRTQQDFALKQQDLNQQKNENYTTLLRNNNVVAPTVSFSPVQNLGLYGYNYFTVYEVRMQDSDVIAFDRYLQRYGVNGLHKPLTKDCFNVRQYYNYVQAFDINIKSHFGKRVREAAISQLNNGVRTWKVLPDASYYELN